MSDGAQRASRSWTAGARAPSTSTPRCRFYDAAPFFSSVSPSDGGKQSGGPYLRPDVLRRSSSCHCRRLDVAAPLLSAVLPLDGVRKSCDADLRPVVLQRSSSVHRRRPDVTAPVRPAVLALDCVEKSGGPDPPTFFTTCKCQRRICITRSEHALTCGKYVFIPASPAPEVGGALEGLRLHFGNHLHVYPFGQTYIPL